MNYAPPYPHLAMCTDSVVDKFYIKIDDTSVVQRCCADAIRHAIRLNTKIVRAKRNVTIK